MSSVWRWLIAVVALLVTLGLIIFFVVEPFLNLPPVWEQLAVGLALIGYGAITMGLVAVFRRSLWPKRWRLSRTHPTRMRWIRRIVDSAWGNEDNIQTGR
jgi:hypothetical protein